VRKGGAAARMMLVQAAADGWNVPAAECSAVSGSIMHGASGRRTSYGKVAQAAAKLQPPTEIALKDPRQWKLVGKRVARLDTVDKTNGKQVYGADLTGTLFTLFPGTDETVFQSGSGLDESLKVETNPKVLPKEGTPVKLVIQTR